MQKQKITTRFTVQFFLELRVRNLQNLLLNERKNAKKLGEKTQKTWKGQRKHEKRFIKIRKKTQAFRDQNHLGAEIEERRNPALECTKTKCEK